MNLFRSLFCIILLFVTATTTATANQFSDRNFEQNRMLTANNNLILLLSPGSDLDYLTAYTTYGTYRWQISLYTKVMSWGILNGSLYVFSKSRYTDSTTLLCVNPDTGEILWERP